MFSGLVLDIFIQPPERPQMLPCRLWDVLADMRQILKDNVRTAVFDGFGNEFVRNPVKVDLKATVLLTTDALNCFMRCPRSVLL